jgi:hypothetical protein
MLKGRTMDREQQIALMVGAVERTDTYVRAWLDDPEFKASLHRYDHKNNDEHRNVKRIASR